MRLDWGGMLRGLAVLVSPLAVLLVLLVLLGLLAVLVAIGA
jgi:hypothetical protein